jgi:hypothetical protein
MKFKKIALTVAAVIVVYKIGMLAGQTNCFNKMLDKYGDILFEKEPDIIVDLSKTLSICRSKPEA